ncbi:aldehyde ferredoxin oxidoreductase family protein [Thermococcus aggregans]|uniref:Aldehyde ferredoxin oxidoreductase family protein n=1 Tax=Thermococcus aggregans TaxID=110163 RepID=A0A9E7SPJ5_THEAG|nr:aldehyde ferredoxin oxidoreductase family protein [Thermococcus aggregans]USS40947.1 aldehyde ferredoxin oxidoreductase family protein [Thermococcus aggregans]
MRKKPLFGRFLEIDLSKEKTSEMEVEPEIIRKFIGGKGIGAYFLYTFLKPKTNPLSPDNLLMFLNGPLTGTPFPSSGRTTVVTKSPLTGLYLDCHAGGYFGPELRKAGWDGIIVKGKSKDPIYLWIIDDEVEFRDASKIWGSSISETVEKIRAETDKKAHIASIGPAGENLVKFAAIMIDKDDDPWRAGVAARGGPGAVMGSKNLKAIAVKGSKEISTFDKGKLRELAVRLNKKIMEHNYIHIRRVIGTAYLVDPMNRLGILPTRNFQQGFIEDHYGIIGPNLRYYTKRDVSCYNCPVVCGRVVEVNGKEVKIEYECIALLGSNNGIKDIRDVAKAVLLCNEFGLDAISTGNIVGFAMECAEKGILPDVPKFGDAEGQRRLIEDIVYRRGIGDVLAEGVKKVAEKIGQGTEKFAMHVKGLEIPGYEPRSSWGMALAYATSDRGACHQRAFTARAEADGILKRFSTKGVARFVKEVQDERAAAFSLVVCDFMPLSIEDFISGLKYAIGVEFSLVEYLKVGERIWNLTRVFNIREAGISRKDDTLPPRVFEEPLPMPPDGEEKIRLPKEEFEKMLEEYYTLRGWDENGIPTKEKLEELGLDKI